jgi:hypothetical protein
VKRLLVTGALLFAGLGLALAGPGAVLTLTGCDASNVPPELAHDLAEGAGACVWRSGQPLPDDVVAALAPDECIRIEAGPASRFTEAGVGCTDVEAVGVRCVLLRADEPQPVQWADRLQEGEILPSVILSGTECRCPE